LERLPVEEFVFPGARGGVLRVGTFRRAHFDKAVKTAGVTGFTPHGLRHAAASFAIASGASVKAVQSMLGRASATQTLDRYAALFPVELDVVADRIDEARRASKVSRTSRGLTAVPSRSHNAAYAV
jgi:integrase